MPRVPGGAAVADLDGAVGDGGVAGVGVGVGDDESGRAILDQSGGTGNGAGAGEGVVLGGVNGDGGGREVSDESHGGGVGGGGVVEDDRVGVAVGDVAGTVVEIGVGSVPSG